jgi:hypothetical protein
MAFTTAGTASVTMRHRTQFQGLFTDIFAISITGADPASVAAGAEDTQTYTVTGLALGDMVLGLSLGVNQTVDGDISAYVSAANTLTIRISNLNAASGLDYAANTIKVLVGRPAF